MPNQLLKLFSSYLRVEFKQTIRLCLIYYTCTLAKLLLDSNSRASYVTVHALFLAFNGAT